MSHPRFAAYSYMIQDSCQGIPIQDLAKYEQERANCIKEDIRLEQSPGNVSDLSLCGEEIVSGAEQKTSGLIFLHGLGPNMGWTCHQFAYELGLSLDHTKLSCPLGPLRHADVIPAPLIPIAPYMKVRSWFNFWKMPENCVTSPVNDPGESKPDLEEALVWVEKEIKMMIDEGIPQENIVVAGASQGAALSLYTAVHTKYKIGGFVPTVTWLPLVNQEPPSTWGKPVNKDTPIFHMNGNSDRIVPKICGTATENAMNQVFTKYELHNMMGIHLTTTINIANMPQLYCWFKSNVPGMKFCPSNPWQYLPC